MRLRILVTGATGQVGWELRRTLANLGEVLPADRSSLNLSHPETLRPALRQLKPALIINAAAYTAVDRAEQEPEVARAINALAPAALAQAAAELGAALVHISTDYVFDGTKGAPYTEEDAPNPLNVYGQTKLEGEQAVQASGAPYLLLRTSWVYGIRGRNFLLTMLRLARERQELRVVADQVGAPTWSRPIAEAIAQIVAQGRRDPVGYLAEKAGLYHLTAGGSTTWYHFARCILEGDPRRSEQVVQQVLPIATAEYPTPTPRPLYSLLDNTRLEQTFGLRLPGWQESLDRALADLAGPTLA